MHSTFTPAERIVTVLCSTVWHRSCIHANMICSVKTSHRVRHDYTAFSGLNFVLTAHISSKYICAGPTGDETPPPEFLASGIHSDSVPVLSSRLHTKACSCKRHSKDIWHSLSNSGTRSYAHNKLQVNPVSTLQSDRYVSISYSERWDCMSYEIQTIRQDWNGPEVGIPAYSMRKRLCRFHHDMKWWCWQYFCLPMQCVMIVWQLLCPTEHDPVQRKWHFTNMIARSAKACSFHINKSSTLHISNTKMTKHSFTDWRQMYVFIMITHCRCSKVIDHPWQ